MPRESKKTHVTYAKRLAIYDGAFHFSKKKKYIFR